MVKQREFDRRESAEAWATTMENLGWTWQYVRRICGVWIACVKR